MKFMIHDIYNVCCMKIYNIYYMEVLLSQLTTKSYGGLTVPLICISHCGRGRLGYCHPCPQEIHY